LHPQLHQGLEETTFPAIKHLIILKKTTGLKPNLCKTAKKIIETNATIEVQRRGCKIQKKTGKTAWPGKIKKRNSRAESRQEATPNLLSTAALHVFINKITCNQPYYSS
tara:strand:- start:559 stop:885 length:327 start_codon:yes stop_codon:yes gene_type:complete